MSSALLKQELDALKDEHAHTLDQLGLAEQRLRDRETTSMDEWRLAWQELAAAEAIARHDDIMLAVSQAEERATRASEEQIDALGQQLDTVMRELDTVMRENVFLREQLSRQAIDTTTLGLELAVLDDTTGFVRGQFGKVHAELDELISARAAAMEEAKAAKECSAALSLEASHLRRVVGAQHTAIEELNAHVSQVKLDAEESERAFLTALGEMQEAAARQRETQEERLRAWEELQRRLNESVWLASPAGSGCGGGASSLITHSSGGVALHSHAAIELIRARRSLDEFATLVADLVLKEQKLVDRQTSLIASVRARTQSRDAVEAKMLAVRLTSMEEQLKASLLWRNDLEAALEVAGREAYAARLEEAEAQLEEANGRLRQMREEAFACMRAG